MSYPQQQAAIAMVLLLLFFGLATATAVFALVARPRAL
jgi:hypothetical protein